MVLVDVGQSQCPVSLCGTVNPLPPGVGLLDGVLAAGSLDGLLNGLNWSVSYVDSCFTDNLEPEVFFDLGSPFMNVVEDDCDGSVGSWWTRLRDVVSGDAAGRSVIVFAALRHPSEDSYRVRDDGRVEFQVFHKDVTESPGSRGGRTHGETFRDKRR